MPHEPGVLLAGRYRLDARIASGGMGDVWLATDTVLARQVAVKTLRPDRAVDSQFQTRFEHEAHAMAALHHPGVVDVYDFGREPGNGAYLVMAYVDGQSLDRRIAERGRLTLADTMAVVAQTARALQAVHDAGILHRDVKPANMIIRSDGTVVLVDFGVARSSRSAALTGAGEVIGTADYIAPEQVSKRTLGPGVDVYALGAVAYHCLSGHPPFLGDNPLIVAMQHRNDDPPPLPEDIPPAARSLVTTALAKDPAARFRSAAAMAAAADRAAGAAPGNEETAAFGVLPDGSPDNHRRPQVVLALAALLVLLGAGTAVAFTDPFGWLPRTPNPATSGPSAPSVASSPALSTRPADGGSTRTPARPTRTTRRTPDPTPSTRPPTPTPSPTAPPPTTAPTQAETTEPPPSAAADPDRSEA
ncbi:serine/threonine-protein kinase [Paractinoplanes rishiriensis]|uniref:non-specific serine/threonine protein kinase n=1 Tax=Paractinoplanes rishiriensis TaxID=1050105 RepID=A0A919MZB4_9ACTN|nr:serine/threonine-protein kinase [Actinoplanes rishiriensis]GIF01304.1 hypothetical protein Ari01nite_87680 [Actinoplanes rishiriensis]